MFGRPADVVGVSRTVLPPALSVTVSVRVAQVLQAPVPSKVAVVAVVPFTSMFAGRAVPVPLA